MSKLLKETIENIKGANFRLTKSRKAIVGVLCQAQRPIIAAEISTKLEELNLKINRITIYRELCFLTQNNFVQKIQLVDHKMYYEIPAEHHHHLICTKCRKIKKITMGNHLQKQEKLICQRENFKFISHSLEFYGVCKRCA